MIYSIIDMKELPQNCGACPMYNFIYKNCHILDRQNRTAEMVNVTHEHRLDCPLRETKESQKGKHQN